jgi:hypothetical protein
MMKNSRGPARKHPAPELCPEELTTWQKAGGIFTGSGNPKPMNGSVPGIAHTPPVPGNERKLHTRSVGFCGSGSSGGNESTIGYKEAADVKTAFYYIAENRPGKIILMGTGKNAASVMKATSERLAAPDRLIRECLFGNMQGALNVRCKNRGTHTFPFSGLFILRGRALNGFWTYSHNPEKYARQIEVPALLLNGGKDNKIPCRKTDPIFNSLEGQKAGYFPGKWT